jgi:diguanylate cyclase (GGDEF)-like protein
MLYVINCIAAEHDLALVVLAAVMCLTGVSITVNLHMRSRGTHGRQRYGWTFLTAVSAGSSIWATHFIAMLGYQPAVPVTFDPVLTIFSLLIAVLGTGIGVALATGGRRRGSLAGGAVFGLAVAAMHYTGMFAYRAEGLVNWDNGYILASIGLSVFFAAVAFEVLRDGSLRYARYAAIGLLVLGIVSLHFTGMTAYKVTPLGAAGGSMDGSAFQALALSIALMGLIIAGAGLTSYLIDDLTRTQSSEKIRHLAHHDSLTTLPNRISYNAHIDHQLQQAEEAGARVAVIGIDLDRFKIVNDVWGHGAGDAVLRTFAERLRAAAGEGEFAARIGGDEFAAIKTFTDEAELHKFLYRLEKSIGMPIQVDNIETHVGASIGIAIFPQDGLEREALVNNADLAMYRAKGDPLNRICFYNPEMGETVRTRRALTDDLRHAIENDQLSVHYQVQTSIQTGEALGYEALLRWRHPERGMVPPSEFIPLAEDNGLILSLGEWVLRRACRDAAAWEPPCKIAINLSAVQFNHNDLARMVHEILIETGLAPSRLELELTETALVKDKMRSLHIIRQIKALGVSIALDDFGTGYSSLETLRIFPFDKIKLDRSFIDGVARDPQSLAIVRAVMALGKSLGVPILAEGIETEEQLSLLKVEACDEAQGYLLGRPTPLENLVHVAGPVSRPGTDAEPRREVRPRAVEAEPDLRRESA